MRILFLSQIFDPEPAFKGLFFAQKLRELGHEVQVLTGFPNYPDGKVYPGYRIQPIQHEMMDGIPVIRVPLFPSHDSSAIRRIANNGSFALSAAILGPLCVHKADVAYVYGTPAPVGFPAAVLRLLRGIPFVFDVLDIWPDSVAHSGILRNGVALATIEKLLRIVYATSGAVVVPAPGLKALLESRSVPSRKIEVIHNWCDERNIVALPRDPKLAERLGMTGKFNVVFAGVMGTVQGLDVVIEAARICESLVPSLQFVMVGGGIEVGRLEARAAELRLKNILFIPRQPVETISSILALADVLLVHLRNERLFHSMIPGKTQAYMAASRPMLMAVAGDATELIEQAGAGIACPPENPEQMANALCKLATLSKQQLDAMGARGRDYYWNHLSMAKGLEKFDRLFHKLAQG